ncbi:vicilin-like antimicrobial peptides 2-2-like [Dorcoceras hygrometricum]|uniref:Vicilin-like antimicrobial peptides 2-2-like n=1 Tax=Dorcoceras hygrometricum TaxID=472368 RepID=A0A2Z7ABM6_9LAMI|nr:vicilin-like antimicrobial peptides 2-2-like [Dorcoceras hygrometricum]
MNSISSLLPVVLLLILPVISGFGTLVCAEEESGDVWASGLLVKREARISLVSSEYGEISAVRVGDEGIGAAYLVHFFTLEPNSLFLPVILHEHMVFYVQTGSGKLSWAEENELKDVDLKPGDVYRLQAGTVFFLQSNLETEAGRYKLRIHALFADSKDELRESTTGPYSSIRDMVLGFDKKVLHAAFKVSGEVIDELLSGAKPPAIVHGIPKTRKKTLEMEIQFISGLVRSREHNSIQVNKKKREKAKLFNLIEGKKDFENDNGWSTTVTGKKLSVLKDTNIGLFMVNLSRGSMMGPHWNPVATEIGVVWQGTGVVRIVCSSTGVEAGFSTSAKRNHPQFFAGQASVLKTLDREVVSVSFNVSKETLDQLLAPQMDSVILGCTSCAEEELRVIEEEMEKEREEARRREEEAARKREEEKARREEEEEKRREEEARRREEEEAKREEEERKRQQEEEEERHREREEEARRKEEEEAKREKAERRRREEEEERREREEEARREEEEEAKREEEEREEARRREEEEAKREEEERKRQQEEEEERHREEEARRKEEEEAKWEEAERKRREEEEERREREEEARRKEEEEEERKRQEEEEEAKREEEERRREEEEEEARREEEEREGREEEEARQGEEERRQREEEETEARAREEEEAWEKQERRREEEEEGKGEEEAREEHRKSEEERAAEEERRREEAESQRGEGGDRPQAAKFQLEW